MRRSIIAMWIIGSGCNAPGDPLESEGPPRVLQVLARERVAVTDDEGNQHVELQARLAFGDHPDIDVEHDDRVVSDAVARDGQRIRIVVDELLRGGSLEEVADDSPAALEEMAKYQAGAGLYSDAIASYTRALQAQPNNQRVKLQRIVAALESKQYQQAATFAADAQQQHQGESTFARLHAMALLELGNKQRAIELLESTAAKFPRDAETQFKLADVYADSGRSTDAERMLRQMLTANPADHRALNYLGYLLAQNGKDLDEAIRLVNRALLADPGRGEYLDSLGWAYYKQGNLNEAEKYLSQAAQKLPDHPEILDHLGDVYAKRGRWQEAIDAWTRALATKEADIEPVAVQRKIEDARGRVGR